MKFLVDQCAGRKIAQWLEREQHDVLEVRTMVPDPGDPAILDRAVRESRVVITRDKGFGKLVHREASPHAGIILLPNVSSERRIEMVREVLQEHRNDLRDHAFVAVDWSGRIRTNNSTEREEPRGRFGQEIQQTRDGLGMRQHELAGRLGISAQYLNDIEHGRRRPLRARLVRRIARELGLQADLLWFRAGRIPPELLHLDPGPEQIEHAMKVLREALGKPSGISLEAENAERED